MRTEGDPVRDVNESPFSAVRSAPRDGDVLVTREAHSAVTYSVRQVPGVAQFHAAFRDEALRLARSFARTMAVDLWYSQDGTYRLLEVYGRQRL